MPEMGYNLFSTAKAVERGATFIITKSSCCVKIGNEVIAEGVKDQATGLFTLRTQAKAGLALLVSTRRTLSDWHKAFGHVDERIIREMSKNLSVEGLEIQDEASNSCQVSPLGKATRSSHTTCTSHKPNQVGSQVNVDLIGAVKPLSLGCARYILLCVDSYSGYSHIYFLKTKDETCKYLQQYICDFEGGGENRRKIETILSDNGSEFNNEAVKTLMAVEHITMRFSSAYVPQQNGTAERNNRTIVEAARCMLAQAGLPLELWAEAASTAVYLRNRVGRKNRVETPFGVFH